MSITCPECEQGVAEGESVCTYCGAPLTGNLIVTKSAVEEKVVVLTDERAEEQENPKALSSEDQKVLSKAGILAEKVKPEELKVDEVLDRPLRRELAVQPDKEEEVPAPVEAKVQEAPKPPEAQRPSETPTSEGTVVEEPEEKQQPSRHREVKDTYHFRFDEEEDHDTVIKKILEKVQVIVDLGYEPYGLFGRPSTGKSCFVYALEQNFINGAEGFGGYSTEGDSWGRLASGLEDHWATKKQVTTARGVDCYQATGRSKKHIGILDIAGEHFEDVQSWTSDIFDFFGSYLTHCKGLFLLIEFDESTVAAKSRGAALLMRTQLQKITAFVRVAAAIMSGDIRSWEELESMRDSQEEVSKKAVHSRLEIPVALCLSKADLVPGMNMTLKRGKVVPDRGYYADPWNVVEEVWPEHLETLLTVVPHLKIEWLSCLGADREFVRASGLRSIFQHVVVNPPPKWAMSAKNLRKFRKWFRV